MTTTDGDDALTGPERTMILVGDAAVTIELSDVKAIQSALLEYLKQSTYPERDELIRWTQGDPAWIDPEGDVRIGPWLLDSTESELILRYRESPGQHAARAHVAHLAKDKGRWLITGLATERISVRR